MTPRSEATGVRFGATLVANIARGVASLVGASLLARGLGAEEFGSLSFLLASMAAILPLADAGSSNAFFTFLSQRPQSRRFISVYSWWLLLQFALGVAFFAAAPQRVLGVGWVGHRRSLLLFSFAASFASVQLWGMVSQLGEARRKTVRVQAAGVVQAVGHAVLLLGLMLARAMSVRAVLGLLLIENVVLSGALARALLAENIARGEPNESTKAIVVAFWDYCKPLIAYNWLSALYVYVDRWMLQQFSGSVQQGFFSIGTQLASISLLAAASVLRVLWKEVSEAHAKQDDVRVRRLFQLSSRAVFIVAAWLSCVVIAYSQEILGWLAGNAYVAGATALAVLLVYPALQALGQVQGTLLYALADTTTVTRIGVVTMVVSIPVAYVMIAPHEAAIPGLGLGASGLAVKTVLVGALAVGLQGVAIWKRHRVEFEWRRWALVLGTLVSLAFGCRWLATAALSILGFGAAPLTRFVIGSSLFVASSLGVVFRWPTALGLGDALPAALQWWPRASRSGET